MQKYVTLTQKPDIVAWMDHYLRKKKENNDLGVNKKPVTWAIILFKVHLSVPLEESQF